MWNGIITKISDVDSSGNTEVMFNIVNDKGVTKYEGKSVTGNPESIVDKIKVIVTDLKNKNSAIKDLTVGQIITVE